MDPLPTGRAVLLGTAPVMAHVLDAAIVRLLAVEGFAHPRLEVVVLISSLIGHDLSLTRSAAHR